MANKLSVYFLSVNAPGHLISMLEVAKSLLQFNSTSSNSFSINFLLMPYHSSPLCSSYLQSVQTQNLPIHFHELPFIEPPTCFDSIEDFISIYMKLYLPLIKASLSAPPSPVSGLVLDMFASEVIDVAHELNIPSYIYYPSTATFLALLFHLSGLELEGENDQIDFSEVQREICVPGLAPVPSISMPIPLMNMKSTPYKVFMHHARRYTEAKGIIVNSNIQIETKAVKALAEGTQLLPGRMLPKIFPIGPIISFGENRLQPQKHECLKWLDRQPAKSVVYLCFGSMGAFEASQVEQIATGLERSRHRFLWVIRTPSKEFLRSPTDANLEELLPKGFLERTKERGLVWPSLVPQIDILSNQAIGGFVTHCGWNSCLESLWFSVPMIPWPLYAEQHLNAFELVNEIGVAIRLDVDRENNGFVGAIELERAVKCLMGGSEEGRRVRDRAEELKWACRLAMEKEGASYVNLQNLAKELIKVENAQQVATDRVASRSSQFVELVSSS